MKKGWTYKKLGEVGTFIRGGGFLKKDYVENGIPCIHYGQIHTVLGTVTKEHLTSIPESLRGKTKFASKGDIIFAITSEDVEGSCKCTAWLGDYDVAVGGHAAIYKHSLFPAYVSYFAKSPYFYKAKEKYVHGFKVMEIKPSDIAQIDIPVPSMQEQKRIVERLDAAFAQIDELKANAEKQLAEARALFQKALAKAMEPKEGWEEKTLPDISENLDSIRVPVTKKDRAEGKYSYYGASGIVDYVDDYLFDEDLLLISEDGANLLMRTYPIAFSVSGKIWVNNHAHALRFKDMSTQRFVEYFFAGFKLDEYISGAAQPKLTQKALNRIPISIPKKISEQQRIVERLDSISENVRKYEDIQLKIIAECDALKQALLRQVFE